jgi:hypothetical protein
MGHAVYIAITINELKVLRGAQELEKATRTNNTATFACVRMTVPPRENAALIAALCFTLRKN